MGRQIVSKMKGMGWTARISLIIACTALISLFVYQGWKSPALVDATTIGPNAATSAAGWTSSTNVYSQNATYATYNNTGQANLVITGFNLPAIPAAATINGVTVTVWGYGDGTSAARRTIRVNLTTNGSAAAGTWKSQAMTTANASYALGGAADTWGATLTPALINTGSFGVLVSDNDTTAHALYVDYVSVAVDYTYDPTAPTIGTVNVTPTSTGYTTSSPTITATVTDADSTVTGCEYTTNGTDWLSGNLTGVSPTWTCTANPTGLSGSLSINVRGTSTGGTGTGTAVSRTVDSSAPTDGALLVSPGNQQNVLTWNAATDPAGIQQYDVRYVTGTTPPATCVDGTSIYTGTDLTYPHGGLTNDQPYAYRVCATDNLGNTSTGATGTGTPILGIPNAVSATSATSATAATESTSSVLMQRLTVNSNTVGGSDNKVVLNSLTMDDAGNATQVASVKIYVDETSSATVPTTAVLIGGKSRWDGASASIPLTGGKVAQRTVDAGTPKYLYIVYDMAFGQSGRTVQSHVTTVGVSAPDTAATVNLSSNSFTLTAGSSAGVVTSCAGCHAYPPVDSTGNRNVPPGSVIGSHTKHNASNCATCHVAPATETSADFGHRDANIQMSAATGYTNGTSFPQTNDLTGANLGTCSTATCHNAYGTTGIATPKWGTAATCASCHDAVTDGSPATGSHTVHMGLAAAACNQCHSGATKDTSGGSGHMDANIDVTNGYPANVTKHAADSYTGTCSTATCHANVYGTGSVTSPVWGQAAGCEACHTTPIAATGPATGSHVAHNESDCSQCHTGATNNLTIPSANHNDNDIDVNSGYPVNVAKHTTASGYSGRTCSTASCHANVYGTGSVTSPVWGQAAGCEACHTTPIDATGPATGSHVAHNESDCSQCHAGATNSTTIPTLNHADNDIDVNSGYPVNVAKHTTASGYSGRTCSTASCHANVYGTGSVTSPAWGQPAGCEACHTTPIAATGPATGSHVAHNTADCSKCHTGATNSTTIPTLNHADNDIDVNSGYPVNVAKHTTASGYSGRTCSTASCHANVYGTGSVTSPAWGQAAGCEACHTTPIAATGPATGSHVAHNTADCSKCHTGATNNTTVPSANHNDNDIDVNSGYPVNVAKHTTASGYSGRTCSTASCHANVYGTGSVTSPAWGQAAGCEACHTTPIAATGPATGSHVAHNTADCSKCHTGATNSTTVPSANHNDNDIDVNSGYPVNVAKHTTASGYSGRTCSTASCHANVYGTGSVTSPAWGQAAGCEACHTTPIAATGPATGSHVAHNESDCSQCHTGATNNLTIPSANHNDNDIDVNSGYPVNVAKHTTASGYSGRTCSTASCHANVYGTGSVTSPAWGQPAGCEACHTTPIAATGPATGSHVAHNTADCSKCHTGATNSTTIPTLNHADNDIDVNSGYPVNVTKHTTASGYSGRTCSTASCHANVYGTGSVTSPAWGQAAGCEACHTTPIAATGPATGSHVAHNTADCSKCHTGATNNTTVPSANHNDNDIDVNSGYPVNVAKHTTASGYSGRTCSTASCHANVYGTGSVTSPAWGQAAGCEACHTTPIAATGPATGSHVAHNESDCSQCHTGATNNLTIPSANHNDNDIDVNSGYPVNVAKHTTASGYSGRTCSTASCHANVYGTGSVTSPAWGQAAGCEACHTTPIDATGPATGSHVAHNESDCSQCHTGATNSTTIPTLNHADNDIDVNSGYPVNVAKHTTASGYSGRTCSTASCHANVYGTGSVTSPAWGQPAGCEACHTTPIAATGPATGSHVAHNTADCSKCHTGATNSTTIPTLNHADNDIDVNSGYPVNVAKHTTASGYSGRTCSTASCHASAYSTATVTTPAWGNSAGCEACHTGAYPITANGPATGSHAAHAGKLCTECHAANTTSTTAPSINHVDGDIDIIIGGYPVNITKHAANTGYASCSNVSCHVSAYSTATVTTPAWGTDANCGACHTAYPITASGPATGSHALHSGTACTNCHASGTTATAAPSAGHIDGDIDTALAGYPTNITKHAAGTGYAAASCSTTSCHGGATMTWGANTTDTSCTKCHGKGTLLANYSTARAWQSAPGYATTGTDIDGQTGTFTNGVSNDAEVGAHDAHLRMVNGYSDRQVLCADCHTIPGAANHATGSTDYSWSNLAKNIGTSISARGALTPGYATGTCSNMYCHGGVLNGGSDTTPVWNDTTFLTSYAKNANNCGKCHGAPPTSGATLGYDHNGVTISTSCAGCHGHDGNGASHIDGTLQAQGGACNACHSYDTVGGVWGSGTRLDGAIAEGWGAHARHIDNLKAARGITLDASVDTYGSPAFNAVCGVCHTRLPANHTMDNSSARFINISSAYQTGSNAPSYLGVSGTSSSVNPKTCSNISCHFNATPRWQ